ncbi:MAG: tRNA(Ile)-lysidine synthase [Verrucomicrobiota bacterium]
MPMKLQAATLERRAAQLAAILPISRWHPEVQAWVQRDRGRSAWAVALSGGVDSVALLLTLWTHFPARRDRLVALHYNHRLRGRAADADERFCRDLCNKLGVTLQVGRRRKPQAVKGEAGARELRLAFFAEAMKRAGTKVLWIAHQQNDVAETMLMRLARGSGAGGLAAPRPVQVHSRGRVHLRPLLAVPRMELEAAMKATRLPWREDASNRGTDFFRNRVRQSVIPAWVKAAGRDAVAGAARSRELLGEDDAALEMWTDAVWAEMPRGGLALKRTADLPRAVVRRLLHRWLLAHGGGPAPSRQAFTALLSAVEAGVATRQSLGAGGFAVIRRHELRNEKAPRK